ncbi:MAG TPA: DUF6468 domain-containing protein [Xanthobacteraceae bacterium]|nr:DUF6468 domain-containing protein [Xanthobacteraceae bacterium]
MSDQFLSLLIESLVAVLLVLTIGYCLILNRRLKRLRADESSLRATIAELVAATTVAERAIEGLRTTVTDCDATLGERLRNAERISADLSRDVRRGDEIISRIHRIAVAAKSPNAAPLEPVVPTPIVAAERPATNRVSAAVAAAQAIASRTRGQAA